MNNNVLSVLKVFFFNKKKKKKKKKEYDAELAEKAKELKYADHNKEWVENMN